MPTSYSFPDSKSRRLFWLTVDPRLPAVPTRKPTPVEIRRFLDVMHPKNDEPRALIKQAWEHLLAHGSGKKKTAVKTEKPPQARERRLTLEDRSYLTEILDNSKYWRASQSLPYHYDTAVRALSKTPFSRDQKLTLLLKLAQVSYDSLGEVYKDLDLGLAALAETDLDFDEQCSLLTLLAPGYWLKNHSFQPESQPYRHLSLVVNAFQKLGLDFSGQYRCLYKMVHRNVKLDETIPHFHDAVMALSTIDTDRKQQAAVVKLAIEKEESLVAMKQIVEELAKTDFTAAQKYRLLLGLLRTKSSEAVSKYLCNALIALRDSPFTAEEKIRFLISLAKASDRVRTSSVYISLSKSITAFKGTPFTIDQQVELIALVVSISDHSADSPFFWFKPIYDHLSQSGMSVDHQCRFLLEHAPFISHRMLYYSPNNQNQTALHSSFLFAKLIAEKAALGPESRYHFYNYYVGLYPVTHDPLEKSIVQIVEILNEAGFEEEQKCRILTRFNKGGERYVRDYYSDLLGILILLKQRNFSPDQQYQLLAALHAPGAGQEYDQHGQQKPISDLLKFREAIVDIAKSELTLSQQFQLLLSIAVKAKKALGEAYFSLTSGLTHVQMASYTPAVQFTYLNNLISLSGEQTELSFRLLAEFENLLCRGPMTNRYLREFGEHYRDLLKTLTEYNRPRVLELILNWCFLRGQRKISSRANEEALALLSFIVRCFRRWPRLGFNILEGLIEAYDRSLLPIKISDSEADLFSFVETTHGFIPAMYRAYKREGREIFQQVRTFSASMLEDKLGVEDLDQIVKKRGQDYLLALIQAASPTSGASFVNKEEQGNLLKSMITAGDLRAHVPPSLAGKKFAFAATQVEWLVRDGETVDPDGRIKDLLDGFRQGKGKAPLTSQDLSKALRNFLKAEKDQKQAAQKTVLALLYELAGQDEDLEGSLESIRDLAYSNFILLEQIFTDNDALKRILIKALRQVPKELFKTEGRATKPLKDEIHLALILNRLWKDPKKSQLDKFRHLHGILSAYNPDEIRTKLLPHRGLDPDLKKHLAKGDCFSSEVGHNRLVSLLLADPLHLIRTEKAKFHLTNAKPINLSLRVVKGPAFGLHGLSSGVCTAADMALWKKKEFFLAAIIDEDQQRVVGYVHLFEQKIGKKKYLTLPGINPSVEFLGTVDGEEFYRELMKELARMAQEGGYEADYIPTDSTINSNRSPIQRAIQKANYPTREIPTVDWNTNPEPYPFSTVYVPWKKGQAIALLRKETALPQTQPTLSMVLHFLQSRGQHRLAQQIQTLPPTQRHHLMPRLLHAYRNGSMAQIRHVLASVTTPTTTRSVTSFAGWGQQRMGSFTRSLVAIR